LSQGTTELQDLLDSDDTRVMLNALRELGCHLQADASSLKVTGIGGKAPDKTLDLFMGNAGTAMRPLTAALALMGAHADMHGVPRMHERPIGDLDSAVMLNVKLKPGMTLMHVIAMTRALGELRSEKDAQPEVYRWTDGTDSWVECTFKGGRLSAHQMHRPPPPDQSADQEPAAPLRIPAPLGARRPGFEAPSYIISMPQSKHHGTTHESSNLRAKRTHHGRTRVRQLSPGPLQ
jgi:hypothetical protein